MYHYLESAGLLRMAFALLLVFFVSLSTNLICTLLLELDARFSFIFGVFVAVVVLYAVF